MGMPANSSSDKRPSNTDRDAGTPGRRLAQHVPRRGRLFHLLWSVTSYVVTNVTVTLFWLVFFVFNRNPLLAWLADNWKCIWVREGRRDLHALHRMIQVLPGGVMTLFPEGTRSRDGAVGPGRPGAGLLILATRPRVVPVAIDGMQAVLPIGRYLP